MAGDEDESPHSSTTSLTPAEARKRPMSEPILRLSAPMYAVYLSDRVRLSKIITGMPFS